MTCVHVLNFMNEEICHLCNQPTHEINWYKQTKLKEKWHEENPNAEYEGWMSI